MSAVKSAIFLSTPVSNPRFKDQGRLQRKLKKICNDWGAYLNQYISVTQKLFGGPELPWKTNERVLVSTLSASIIRFNNGAILSEELPVKKKSATNEFGRCDLWAHIPAKAAAKPFSFYLEAKKFLRERKVDEIERLFTGAYGIRRMFSDYAKSRGGRIDQRSAYGRIVDRRHTHYIIGMIGLPLACPKTSVDQIEEIFMRIFSGKREIEDNKKRRLSRYPSVGIFARHQKSDISMLATLTILGSSNNNLML